MAACKPLTDQQRRLAEQHLDVAASAAQVMRRNLPAHADFDAIHGEALFALARAAGRWDGTGDFRSYAFICGLNAIRDMFRKDISSNPREVCELFDLPARTDMAREAIAVADYRALLATLVPDQQRTLAMVAAGFRPADVAEIFGVPIETVASRLWRCRRTLEKRRLAA